MRLFMAVALLLQPRILLFMAATLLLQPRRAMRRAVDESMYEGGWGNIPCVLFFATFLL